MLGALYLVLYHFIYGGIVVASIILSAALAYGVPPWMLDAVAYVESSHRPYAVNVNRNGSQDRGLFQLNDRAHPEVDAFDPNVSARYAARYLKRLYQLTGSWYHALTAYNVGYGRWMKGYRPARYARLVLSFDLKYL